MSGTASAALDNGCTCAYVFGLASSRTRARSYARRNSFKRLDLPDSNPPVPAMNETFSSTTYEGGRARWIFSFVQSREEV